LTFSVAKLSGAGGFQQVNEFIRKHHFKDKCGIIFCTTTPETKTMNEWLMDSEAGGMRSCDATASVAATKLC
jgi:superfamily II DNA helicase RecQ